MSKGWFVVHAYSGQENKVEKQIRKMIENGELTDFIFDVKVPSEEIVEVKDGKKRVTSKKFLPGYVLVEMDLPDSGWKTVCSEIKKIALTCSDRDNCLTPQQNPRFSQDPT